MSEAHGKDVLSFAVPLSALSLPVSMVPDLVHVTTGPYRGNFGVEEGRPWFDSGVRNIDGKIVPAKKKDRSDVVSLVQSDDVFHHNFPQGYVGSPHEEASYKQVITGAKLLLFDQEENTYLIKDGDKLLDLVGGKVEDGESSIEALMREIREEIGALVVEPKLVGLSSQLTKECDFHSFVYIAPLPLTVVSALSQYHLVKFVGFDFPYEKSVPWLPRLITSISVRSGGRAGGLPKLYSTLSIKPYRRKKKIYQAGQHFLKNSYVDFKTLKKRL